MAVNKMISSAYRLVPYNPQFYNAISLPIMLDFSCRNDEALQQKSNYCHCTTKTGSGIVFPSRFPQVKRLCRDFVYP